MLKELEQQLEEIRQAGELRNSLIEAMMNKVKELCVERDKLQSKLEQAEDLRDKYFTDLKDSRNHVEELQLKMDTNPFCLVLIDADNTLFCDGYVKRGSAGGRDAAVHLDGHLMKLLKTKENFQPHWKVIIRLYANISKLGEAYVTNRVIHDTSIWHNFVQAFNKEAALCEFVDAGGDKESADTTIKETFSLFFANIHCKHIVLAASGDNGYTGFLRKYAPVQGISDFVTLIEARPFPAQLRQIAGSFLVEVFPTIFRTSDLGSLKSPAVMQNHKSIISSTSEVPSISQNAPVGPNTYAARAAGTQLQALPVSRSTSSSDPTSNSRLVRLCFNGDGQRIDSVLPYNKRFIAPLKARKLCNAFFLSKCDFANCVYDHCGSLTHEELNTLRYIAKLKPCQSIYCQDACCISGHACPYDGNCNYGNNCKFSVTMHNVDIKINNARTMEIVI